VPLGPTAIRWPSEVIATQLRKPVNPFSDSTVNQVLPSPPTATNFFPSQTHSEKIPADGVRLIGTSAARQVAPRSSDSKIRLLACEVFSSAPPRATSNRFGPSVIVFVPLAAKPASPGFVLGAQLGRPSPRLFACPKSRSHQRKISRQSVHKLSSKSDSHRYCDRFSPVCPN